MKNREGLAKNGEDVMEDVFNLFSGGSSQNKGQSFIQGLDSVLNGSLQNAKELKQKDDLISNEPEDVAKRVDDILHYNIEFKYDCNNPYENHIEFRGNTDDFRQFYQDVKNLDSKLYASQKLKAVLILDDPCIKERYYSVDEKTPIILDGDLNLVVDKSLVTDENINSLYDLSKTYDIYDLYELGIQLQYANEYLNKSQIEEINTRYETRLNNLNEDLITINELILKSHLGELDDSDYLIKCENVMEYREKTKLTGHESGLSANELEMLGYGLDGYDLVDYFKESELKGLENLAEYYKSNIDILEISRDALLNNIKKSNARYVLNNDIDKVIQVELNGMENSGNKREDRLSKIPDVGDNKDNPNFDKEY